MAHLRRCLGTLLLLAMTSAPALAQFLKVGRTAWDGLSQGEQAAIQQRQVIEIYENGTYGLVVDTQGVDQSTPGTNGGAILGSAVGQAAYIDRAISHGNYSAKTQLATALLGGLLGSALDRPANRQFQFRYALKLPNGEIQYMDSVQQSAFRHPPGMCLAIPALTQISQAVCSTSSDDLRRQHLSAAVAVGVPGPVQAPVASIAQPPLAVPVSLPTEGAVVCRIGTLPPVSTTSEKCTTIGGTVQ